MILLHVTIYHTITRLYCDWDRLEVATFELILNIEKKILQTTVKDTHPTEIILKGKSHIILLYKHVFIVWPFLFLFEKWELSNKIIFLIDVYRNYNFLPVPNF